MINTLEQGAESLKEVKNEVGTKPVQKEPVLANLSREGTEALKGQKQILTMDLLREITRDVEQLSIYLPHVLHQHSLKAASIILLHMRQQQLPQEQRRDLLDAIRTESEENDFQEMGLGKETQRLMGQITEKDQNSKLYKLLTSVFYIFYAGWLPLYLHDSKRPHYILREVDCRTLGSIVRSQLPTLVTDCLEDHFAAYAYLLGKMERDWQIAWKMLKKATDLCVGAPACSHWLLKTLERTGNLLELSCNLPEDVIPFLEQLEEIMGALQYSLLRHCEHLPDMEDVDLWALESF